MYRWIHLHTCRHPTFWIFCRPVNSHALYTPSNDQQACFFTFNSPLSNMFPCAFQHANKCYNCAEQFITELKALRLVFSDFELASNIMRMTSPHQMKRAAKHVRNLNKGYWHHVAPTLIYAGLLSKFRSNELCRTVLLATGDKVIVEASPADRFWGVGLDLKNPNMWDLETCRRRGCNVMGRLLMDVRSALRR